MKRLNLTSLVLAIGCAAAGLQIGRAAPAAPFLIHNQATTYNHGSYRGVPISSSPNNPVGSDGRGPATSSGSPKQFQSVLSPGAVVRPAQPEDLDPSQSYVRNAQSIVLVRVPNNGKFKYVLDRALVGMPYISRTVSFSFGSIIPVPETDENGGKDGLTNSVSGGQPIRPEDYWRAEPQWPAGQVDVNGYHVGASYYWSPNAREVFANQAGFVEVVWRKAEPTNPIPTSNLERYVEDGGNYFRIVTNTFLVSGSAVKTPRKMFWTQGKGFADSGTPITVPKGRVTGLKFSYNSSFPEFVAQAYDDSSGTNTIHFDSTQRLILAANLEGRILMEILGDRQTDGSYQHLGFEILDVVQRPAPQDLTVELGERLTVPRDSPDSPGEDELFPANPTGVTPGSTRIYYETETIPGSDHVNLYATREASGLEAPKVQWLEESIGGLRWPFILVRYTQVWPSDPAKYSHYFRPIVADAAEAQLTAVQLPADNAPSISYQDDEEDERAQITGSFKFFTFLEASSPVHRTLIHYQAGKNLRYERVFSWLDQSLKTGAFANSVPLDSLAATNWLTGWDTNKKTFVFSNPLAAPRIIDTTVEVGQRISAPSNETGSGAGSPYLAGHIRADQGISYDPNAYIDPFARGFDEAARGAIIPVNSIPENNTLEVWWFRPNAPDQSKGFKVVYWPSIIGRYTIQWPSAPQEIVLASNAGSGALGSLEAKGRIYYQNDRSLPGYNPNEEHALMSGGQAFALRDDLNITTTDHTSGKPYSSAPFVLLEYTAADGRLAITPFKVLREKDDITFEYIKEAGAILQPPMPLPLLEPPVPGKVAGQPDPLTLNTEIGAWTVASSSDSGEVRTITTTSMNYFRTFSTLAVQHPGTFEAHWFVPTSAAPDEFKLEGYVVQERPVVLGDERISSWKRGDRVLEMVPGAKVFRVSTLALDGVLLFEGLVGPISVGGSFARLADSVPGFANWSLSNEPLPSSVSDETVREFYSSFTLKDRKGNVWIYRGPHDANDDATMQMQFYYKTLPGFFFPTLDEQPAVGTITKYLREKDSGGGYIGDEVNPNKDAFVITYHPVWPATAPALQMAESLTLPKRGLPAIRGQTSLQVVYQQSEISSGLANRSVVLHDPTREKVFELGPKDGNSTLGAIPDSVKTQIYKGKTYFPNLPPHLAQRFFFDSNRGANGALVFKGEFVDEPVGEKYLLLNVISVSDEANLKDLCATGDPKKNLWDAVITSGLKTRLELFQENLAKPGTYIPTSSMDKGPADLATITDDDTAVDSYALTATGPGTGYVTLIAGNGRAFTPPDEPTSLYIIKVVDTLHPGELKIILPQNPLSEQLTLQQTVDLAGQAQDYNFEWKIASPVDGSPPDVYQNQRRLLLGDGTWSHLVFPKASDDPATIQDAEETRVAQDVTSTSGFVIPIRNILFDPDSVTVTRPIPLLTTDWRIRFGFEDGYVNRLVPGNKLTLRDTTDRELSATVQPDNSIENPLGLINLNEISVTLDDDAALPGGFEIAQIYERIVASRPQSIVFRQFDLKTTNLYTSIYLSMDLDGALGAEVYLDGALVVVANRGAADTPTVSAPGTLLPLNRVYRFGPEFLSGGVSKPDDTMTHTVAVALSSSALPDANQQFKLQIEAFESEDVTGVGWLPLAEDKFKDGVRAILGGTADVRSLSDNYLIMRYQAKHNSHASFKDMNGDGRNDVWSAWTTPQLAEGWIKRALAGINPFNQRVTDLFNNRVNTDVSLITQAGHRWEGDVALNLETINASGLIEIYETILRRGKLLSIGGDINYGPANDALLLVSGYLNDLYTMLGNEAWVDASNPTIGIGTKDSVYGDIATALFSFKGQMPSLLEEELALLRGRDDFLQPGVETPPVYNRLFWNYTRGIDSGEVIYALNYNIQEDPSHGSDGAVNADDARRMYPQGHGDAYGHYLTALKGYYGLLLDKDFDWVPRTEAVTILGKPVQVDYLDERKFAASAAAVARAGKQIFDLTWKRDYQPGADSGWEQFGQTRSNTRRAQVSTRFWGMDHWAARAGEGAYLNWVVGNALLPETDPDPTHEGIQKIDRTTVPELLELPAIMEDLQTSLQNAEALLTPLGMSEGGIAFDINPNLVVGGEPITHFEQIYARALAALNNALAAFDDAKDVTRLMRSEEDSLADFRSKVEQQELAYGHALIELYGTPYTDDIGPGRTYPSGFTGPDLIHYAYVDQAELNTPLFATDVPTEVRIDVQAFPDDYLNRLFASPDWIVPTDAAGGGSPVDIPILNIQSYKEGEHFISYKLDAHGFFGKPLEWKGRRASPGQLQQAISQIIRAQNWAGSAFADMDWAKWDLDKAIQVFNEGQAVYNLERDINKSLLDAKAGLLSTAFATELITQSIQSLKDSLERAFEGSKEALPLSVILGAATGGDGTAPARAALRVAYLPLLHSIEAYQFAFSVSTRTLQFAQEQDELFHDYNKIQPLEHAFENQQAVVEIGAKLSTLQGLIFPINSRLQELDDARRNYQALVAKGDRIQEEREVYRKRAAAVIQGYRTRDAAFRIFRNEKLERYKTLFDLAARYAYLAAQAYDYETGLLNTDQGRQFISRIVNARALGVVKNGAPQYAGSNTGDPGLSSVLAEMKADWEVLKGRLGFNNADAYGTTFSMRTENYRILPGTEGAENWRDILNQSRMDDILVDPDVRRYCMQIDSGNGLPVPGIVLSFSSTIADGLNFFGKTLTGGDHAFSPSSFATKIYAAGIHFEGYQGMDNPAANWSAVAAAGGTSPGDPSALFLNPLALSANPYVYLIPVGVDSMRTPPLGDQSSVRTWNVNDVTVPLPFNVGGSEFSTRKLFQTGDFLTEDLFSTRKHQAFRPVSTASAFSFDLYGSNGQLQPSQYTNRRLVGRSAWNSRWKIVIPGRTLLNDPKEGLNRFIGTVTDVKLHFVTYSYSGN